MCVCDIGILCAHTLNYSPPVSQPLLNPLCATSSFFKLSCASSALSVVLPHASRLRRRSATVERVLCLLQITSGSMHWLLPLMPSLLYHTSVRLLFKPDSVYRPSSYFVVTLVLSYFQPLCPSHLILHSFGIHLSLLPQ